MDEKVKKYLIHVRLGGTESIRLRKIAERVMEIIKQLSNGQFVMAYTTPGDHCFGVIANINKPAAVIRAAIDGNGSPFENNRQLRSIQSTTGLTNEDSVFVIECGNDFSENGYGKVLAWLQHH